MSERKKLVQALQEEEVVNRRDGGIRQRRDRDRERDRDRSRREGKGRRGDRDEHKDRRRNQTEERERERERERDQDQGRKRKRTKEEVGEVDPEEEILKKERQKRIKRILEYSTGNYTGESQRVVENENENEDEDQNEEENDKERELREQFEADLIEEIGFHSFSSTKGKEVMDNTKGFGRGKKVVRSELRARQYINRKLRTSKIPAKKIL